MPRPAARSTGQCAIGPRSVLPAAGSISLTATPSTGLFHLDVITPTADGVLIDIRVIPRAAKSGLAGTRDGALLVRLNAPPVEGAANAELLAVLAEAFGVPKRAVALVSGERSRSKRVRIVGLSAAEVATRAGISPGGTK